MTKQEWKAKGIKGRAGSLTFDPLSANFFQLDQPPLREVEVVYWFSLESQPVIIEANM